MPKLIDPKIWPTNKEQADQLLKKVLPEIGTKISLLSNTDTRYEGILLTIDVTACTVAVGAVRFFGTEHRVTMFPVAPLGDILNYLVFQASIIKDISVIITFTPVPTAETLNSPNPNPNALLHPVQHYQTVWSPTLSELQEMLPPGMCPIPPPPPAGPCMPGCPQAVQTQTPLYQGNQMFPPESLHRKLILEFGVVMPPAAQIPVWFIQQQIAQAIEQPGPKESNLQPIIHQQYLQQMDAQHVEIMQQRQHDLRKHEEWVEVQKRRQEILFCKLKVDKDVVDRQLQEKEKRQQEQLRLEQQKLHYQMQFERKRQELQLVQHQQWERARRDQHRMFQNHLQRQIKVHQQLRNPARPQVRPPAHPHFQYTPRYQLRYPTPNQLCNPQERPEYQQQYIHRQQQQQQLQYPHQRMQLAQQPLPQQLLQLQQHQRLQVQKQSQPPSHQPPSIYYHHQQQPLQFTPEQQLQFQLQQVRQLQVYNHLQRQIQQQQLENQQREKHERELKRRELLGRLVYNQQFEQFMMNYYPGDQPPPAAQPHPHQPRFNPSMVPPPTGYHGAAAQEYPDGEIKLYSTLEEFEAAIESEEHPPLTEIFQELLEKFPLSEEDAKMLTDRPYPGSSEQAWQPPPAFYAPEPRGYESSAKNQTREAPIPPHYLRPECVRPANYTSILKRPANTFRGKPTAQQFVNRTIQRPRPPSTDVDLEKTMQEFDRFLEDEAPPPLPPPPAGGADKENFTAESLNTIRKNQQVEPAKSRGILKDAN